MFAPMSTKTVEWLDLSAPVLGSREHGVEQQDRIVGGAVI